jgi:hypothetical protein
MKYPGSSAISVHSSGTGNIVEGNLATEQVDTTGGDGNGIIVDLMNDGAGVVVRNNIAYRNVGAGLNTTSSPNCVIANNAFVENGFGASQDRRGAGIKLSRDDDLRQTIINNIFCDNRIAGILTDNTLDRQTLLDHNLYYSAANKSFVWDSDEPAERQYGTVAEIWKHTHWERHAVSGNPRFVDPEQLDFRLLPSSPAVDAGMETKHVLMDFNAVKRPLGAGYEIGPWEFLGE